jgi:putative tricarboxylic transport membrane protein
MRPGNATDVWSGVLLALAGAGIVVQARGWEYMTQDGPGAGFLPFWYGVAMIVLSLALIAVSARRRLEAEPIRWSTAARPLAAWTALAVCVGLLELIGFAAAYGLLCFFLVAFVHRRPLWVATIVAVLAAAGFWLLFDFALGVQLPRGLLGAAS